LQDGAHRQFVTGSTPVYAGMISKKIASTMSQGAGSIRLSGMRAHAVLSL
jgi:hypothetical protein